MTGSVIEHRTDGHASVMVGMGSKHGCYSEHETEPDSPPGISRHQIEQYIETIMELLLTKTRPIRIAQS